jgi:glycerol-3-phosphate cytidylyltransferase
MENRARMVLTYGTFDVFHFGHFNLLMRAAKLGDGLFVGVSTDEFNAVKGKTAQLSFEERCQYLRQLKFVVDVFPENDWNQKIEDVKRLEPTFFVMGDDWSGKFDFLSEYTKVIYLPRTPDISSAVVRQIIGDQ